MASSDSAFPWHLEIGLISLGAAATAAGGLGVGFRAAGLGYLGHSLFALVVGVVLLSLGLRIAAASRRSMMTPVRLTPSLVATTPFRPTPERIRVHAWSVPHLELPPGRMT